MNVQPLQVDKQAAAALLREYKEYRGSYDDRDWEIERIYRAIARGKTVISVSGAILAAGLDDQNRPKLAICRADAKLCRCLYRRGELTFRSASSWTSRNRIKIEWPGFVPVTGQYESTAILPRIPPKHRPPAAHMDKYHVLWEADWTDHPRDPYLLRRIGKDAWLVLAAWDLTDVEMSVIRAHHQ